MIWEPTTLNCGGRLIDLATPIVMGIINATPDSFHKASRYRPEEIQTLAKQMIDDGAKILDVGGMSSRPGAETVPIRVELERVIPIIKEIREVNAEIAISIDTIHAKVAEAALAAGADMVNDISAWSFDPELFELVAERNVPYVLMHMQGNPSTMQQDPIYEEVVVEILDFLINKLAALTDRGMHDVIVDPGFGFGKRMKDNFDLIAKLAVFKILDKPIMIGLSRKTTIQRTLNVSAENSLNGTTALHMIALQQGAKILRVHDVKPAMECILLHQALNHGRSLAD